MIPDLARPSGRVEAKLRQEGKGDALLAESHTTGMGWRAVRQADVKAAPKEILMVIVRADRQGRIPIRQAGADLEFQLKGALKSRLDIRVARDSAAGSRAL